MELHLTRRRQLGGHARLPEHATVAFPKFNNITPTCNNVTPACDNVTPTFKNITWECTSTSAVTIINK